MAGIVVIGSSNTDMVIKSRTLPRPGETVIGGKFVCNAGGKGANQAVAAARLGANVAMVARVGADMFGEQVAEGMRVLYGGSMNPGNVEGLMAQPNIDGGLVGGASLKADFANIVNY